MSKSRYILVVCFLLIFALSELCQANFDITYSFQSANDFSSQQREIIMAGFEEAATLWESVILGYEAEPDESIVFPVQIIADNSGLAAAGPRQIRSVGEFFLPQSGNMWINKSQVEAIADGFGLAPPGTNFMNELLAHEIGHALGFGSLWDINGTYEHNSGEYRGEHALAAYKTEFDEDANFVPVELAGGGGSANSHWNQLFRSSPEEGNPDDPLSLSPLTGIVDYRGRDLAQDLMSPAIDPDHGEPYLSNTTVQAMRDIGYRVIPQFPISGDMNEDGVVDLDDIDFLSLQIRSESTDPYFDLNSDNSLDFNDHQEWTSLTGTIVGDSNFDGKFDSNDLVFLFEQGEFEDESPMNSGWSSGDWNGDADFGTDDLVYAFQVGAYELDEVVAVPEPDFLPWSLFLFLFTIRLRRYLGIG